MSNCLWEYFFGQLPKTRLKNVTIYRNTNVNEHHGFLHLIFNRKLGNPINRKRTASHRFNICWTFSMSEYKKLPICPIKKPAPEPTISAEGCSKSSFNTGKSVMTSRIIPSLLKMLAAFSRYISISTLASPVARSSARFNFLCKKGIRIQIQGIAIYTLKFKLQCLFYICFPTASGFVLVSYKANQC